ncbi:putative B3 domain-containing protein REM15 [Macadamia integrifolia]|uniref:putative B3 domain-containing protein REM15 n=1 Tax=Macadamia integrifolia TaxID=60698 RepID=UPI001C4E36FC|nr:putative B3 domain-containing protein REM15 [Macadamia integrifolia]
MAPTRIRPKKPHFFTPILPASFQELVIPNAFHKYLFDENYEGGEATLRNHSLCGKSWTVNLKGFCFQEGWTDFVRDNNLQLGDFVVFGYEGSMVFDVIIFGKSFLDKDYPPLHVTNTAQSKSKSDNPPSRRVMTRSKGEKVAKECPSFAVTIREFHLKKTMLNIPKRFVISNGLIGKRYEVILRDAKGRPWPVKLRRTPSNNRMYILGGWLKFSDANHLKKDDVCVFKFGSRGEGGGNMVFDVKVFDYNDPRAAEEIHEPLKRITFFVTSLRQFNLDEYCLGVPKKVVISNGLAKTTFETILTDGKGNSWPVKLKHKRNGQTSITGDWKVISASNGLKVGDSCSIELIQKGMMKPTQFQMH